jgi:hypothetical protein
MGPPIKLVQPPGSLAHVACAQLELAELLLGMPADLEITPFVGERQDVVVHPAGFFQLPTVDEPCAEWPIDRAVGPAPGTSRQWLGWDQFVDRATTQDAGPCERVPNEVLGLRTDDLRGRHGLESPRLGVVDPLDGTQRHEFRPLRQREGEHLGICGTFDQSHLEVGLVSLEVGRLAQENVGDGAMPAGWELAHPRCEEVGHVCHLVCVQMEVGESEQTVGAFWGMPRRQPEGVRTQLLGILDRASTRCELSRRHDDCREVGVGACGRDRQVAGPQRGVADGGPQMQVQVPTLSCGRMPPRGHREHRMGRAHTGPVDNKKP